LRLVGLKALDRLLNIAARMSAAVFVALVVHGDSLYMQILFCSVENLYLYVYISFMHGMSTMGPFA
jgi:hypothetical protein